LNTTIGSTAVKFDSQGRLYATDAITGNVLRFDYGDWGNGQVLANLSLGFDNLAIDSRGQVYVSTGENCIAKILPNGNYVLLAAPGMSAPNGVAAVRGDDGSENVYVADVFNIRGFDGRTGKQISLDAAGLPSWLGSIAPDGNNLIVSSALSGAITRWDPIDHEALEDMQDPYMPQAAISYGQDAIVVSDLLTGQVVRFTSGARNPDPVAQLAVPVGLAADGANLWVADYYLGQVFKIQPGFQPVAANLSGPTSLAYYPPDGSLLVIEADAGRLSRIDPATGSVTMLAELQVGASVGAFYNSIAVGPSGAIYVTGFMPGIKSNILYRIEIHR
jgi:hypothetical protein